MDDNYRVESAVSATSSGNLTYDKWPHDVATALGFAGHLNPLGFSIVRYLSDTPRSVDVWNIVLILATALGKKGVAADTAREMAWRGFEWWRDSRCTTCHGRGVTEKTKQRCPACAGSGKRSLPAGPEPVLMAISALVEAECWMERQLGSSLRRA